MELSLAGPESGAVCSAGTPERFQSRETHEVRTEGGKGEGGKEKDRRVGTKEEEAGGKSRHGKGGEKAKAKRRDGADGQRKNKETLLGLHTL